MTRSTTHTQDDSQNASACPQFGLRLVSAIGLALALALALSTGCGNGGEIASESGVDGPESLGGSGGAAG